MSYTALTVCQPYAELIISGQKPIENRRWSTNHRGPLLIHAGKSRDWLDTWPPMPKGLVFGAILGMVQLIDCLPLKRLAQRWPQLVGNLHAEGPFCWVLDAPHRLTESIPYRGEPGLFDVPAEVLEGAVYVGGHCQ